MRLDFSHYYVHASSYSAHCINQLTVEIFITNEFDRYAREKRKQILRV